MRTHLPHIHQVSFPAGPNTWHFRICDVKGQESTNLTFSSQWLVLTLAFLQAGGSNKIQPRGRRCCSPEAPFPPPAQEVASASPPSCRRVLQQVGISVFPFLPTATLLGFLHREPPPKACCCRPAVARGPKPRGSGGLAQLNPFRSLSLTGSPTAVDTSSPREQGPVCFPAGQALGHQSSSQAAKVQLGSVGRQQEGSTASS